MWSDLAVHELGTGLLSHSHLCRGQHVLMFTQVSRRLSHRRMGSRTGLTTLLANFCSKCLGQWMHWEGLGDFLNPGTMKQHLWTTKNNKVTSLEHSSPHSGFSHFPSQRADVVWWQGEDPCSPSSADRRRKKETTTTIEMFVPSTFLYTATFCHTTTLIGLHGQASLSTM